MNITIDTIPHEAQRLGSLGDWQFDASGYLLIRVSELADERMETLVAVHELVEALLCKYAGISEEDVDAFDLAHIDSGADTGDEPDAPYVKQHCFATGIERLLAAEMGVEWKAYEQRFSEVEV